jgi:DNA-binding response OmpR family regulator
MSHSGIMVAPNAEIVVVDADEASLHATMAVLGEIGAPMRGYSDRGLALSIVRARQTALLVVATDPTGVEALAFARSVRLGLGAQSPRILLIAGESVRRADLTVVDDIVRRPWRADALLDRVRRLLRTSAPPSLGRASLRTAGVRDPRAPGTPPAGVLRHTRPR